MQERSSEKESDKQEWQKLSVMHGEGIIEDMGCLILNKHLPLLCSIGGESHYLSSNFH